MRSSGIPELNTTEDIKFDDETKNWNKYAASFYNFDDTIYKKLFKIFHILLSREIGLQRIQQLFIDCLNLNIFDLFDMIKATTDTSYVFDYVSYNGIRQITYLSFLENMLSCFNCIFDEKYVENNEVYIKNSIEQISKKNLTSDKMDLVKFNEIINVLYTKDFMENLGLVKVNALAKIIHSKHLNFNSQHCHGLKIFRNYNSENGIIKITRDSLIENLVIVSPMTNFILKSDISNDYIQNRCFTILEYVSNKNLMCNEEHIIVLKQFIANKNPLNYQSNEQVGDHNRMIGYKTNIIVYNNETILYKYTCDSYFGFAIANALFTFDKNNVILHVDYKIDG